MAERNLELRAAHYFGMEREPRVSVKVGHKTCLIVRQRAYGRTALAVYTEERREPRGEYLSLTDRQLENLIAALRQQVRNG